MKLKKAYHPVFRFISRKTTEMTDEIYGFGHDTPEKAYQEGLNHKEKFGDRFEILDDGYALKFAEYVISVYKLNE